MPVNKELLVPPLCSVIFKRLHSHLGMSQEPVGNSLVNWIGRQQYEGQLDGNTFFSGHSYSWGPLVLLEVPQSQLFSLLCCQDNAIEEEGNTD